MQNTQNRIIIAWQQCLILFLILSLIMTSCRRYQRENEPKICQPPMTTPSTSSKRPNILFILTDDQSADSLIYMPNVQELLVNHGILMENFFVNVPLCCPSRATILLGQYSHNSGILKNGGDTGGFKTFFRNGLERNTINAGLWEAGYKTALFGKYLNGYPGAAKKRTYVPPGWDEWYSPVVGDPYSNYYYKLNENGEIVNYKDAAEDYLTDVLAGKALDFIKRHEDLNQPFFIYLAVYTPHGPATPAPRHSNLFPELVAPRDPSFNEQDVTDKPDYIRERIPLTLEAFEELNQQYRKRIQSLQAIDEMVADLVNKLSETNQLENTYIIYTSDNGVHMGHHRLEAGKHTPYDMDIRVPMIIRGPGIPRGEIRSEIAGNVDLAPTFAEIAGTSYPNSCDGRSLMPVLLKKNEQIPWRDGYLIQQWMEKSYSSESLTTLEVSKDKTLEPLDPTDIPIAQGLKPGLPPFQGVRTASFKYVEYSTGELEYYDLISDPYELNNIIDKLEPDYVKKLSRWLHEFNSCYGEKCRTTDILPAGIDLLQRENP